MFHLTFIYLIKCCDILARESARGIAAYFEDEEHLHRLRIRLLNMEGYRRQSDIDMEWAAAQAEQEKIVAALKEEQSQEVRRMTKEHEDALRRIEKDHEAELQRVQGEFEEYKTCVQKEMRESSKRAKELARWQGDYGELAAVYADFSALSPRHRDAIAGIFGGGDTPFDFFCGALQRGHLEQLWDYVVDELGAGDADEADTANLSALFAFSFAAVNRSQYEPLFRRLEIPLGTVFDGDAMGRAAGSPQLGRVERVIFAGFAHAVTGHVIRRSLVYLG